MCKKAKCAYLRDDDYCLMHKAACCLSHPDARCCDGVSKVPESVSASQRRYMNCLRATIHCGKHGSCLHPNRRKDRGSMVFKTCKRKTRFTTLERARQVAVHIERRDGIILAVYECPFCHGYHLTKQLRSSLRWNGNANFMKSA